MFNIHRNFFVDNLIKELGIIKPELVDKLPYTDNTTIFDNDNVSLYFIDIDRLQNTQHLLKDILKIEKKQI